jgi:hypothetical protein
MYYAYKYRLKPSDAHHEELDRHRDICRQLYNHDHSPLILTAVSSTATRVGCADGGSGTLSASRCTHCQIA